MNLRIFSNVNSLNIYEWKIGFTNDRAIDLLIMARFHYKDMKTFVLNKYFVNILNDNNFWKLRLHELFSLTCVDNYFNYRCINEFLDIRKSNGQIMLYDHTKTDYQVMFFDNKYTKYDQVRALLINNNAIIIDIHDMDRLVENFVRLEIYEYYDGDHIDYKLNTGVIGNGLIKSPTEGYDENLTVELFIQDNLHKMTKLKEFSFTSRFRYERTFECLKTKPQSLHALTLQNLLGLDLNFLDGINTLTIMEYGNFDECAYKFPLSIKYVIIETISEEECKVEYEFDRDNFDDVEYEITFNG